MKKKMSTSAGSAELQVMKTIHFNIHASAEEASSLCTKIASFNGLTTPKLIDARFNFFFFFSRLCSFGLLTSSLWQVCKHRFSFTPLYDEKAPTRLPLKEFVVGAAMKVWRCCRVPHVFLLLGLLLSVWLVTLSFITFWTWRLAFVRSFGEAQRLLLLSHVSSTRVVLTDCLLGFLLSATIIFILGEAASLRNFIRHLERNFLFYVRIQSPLFPLFSVS